MWHHPDGPRGWKEDVHIWTQVTFFHYQKDLQSSHYLHPHISSYFHLPSWRETRGGRRCLRDIFIKKKTSYRTKSEETSINFKVSWLYAIINEKKIVKKKNLFPLHSLDETLSSPPPNLLYRLTARITTLPQAFHSSVTLPWKWSHYCHLWP